MKTTGYEIREALKFHELQRDAALQAFEGAFYSFEDEAIDETPTEVMARVAKHENAIAALQVAQMQYNLKVQVKVRGMGTAMSLASIVKRLGGAERAEKCWKGKVIPVRRGRYSHDGGTVFTKPTVIEEDKEHAKLTMSAKEVVQAAAAAADHVSALRSALGAGNGVAEDIDLDPSLLERGSKG